MNTTPGHLDDELLSALLDGEDAGGPDAAAHLAACERCAARQAELGAARAALVGAPVEPLDELARRRLVAGALGAFPLGAVDEGSANRMRRLPRHPALVGSAAAVILALLVAVPFVTGNGGGTDGESLTAQAPAEMSRDESAAVFLGDLGDLGNRDHLRLRLGGVATDASLGYVAPIGPGASPAAGAPSPTPVPAAGLAAEAPPTAAQRSAGPTTTLAGGAGSGAAKAAENSTADSAEGPDTFASSDQAASGGAADRDRADTEACVTSLLNGPARGGRLLRSGTGTYRGRPAVVASFELEGGTVAFVTDRSGCAVRDRFPV